MKIAVIKSEICGNAITIKARKVDQEFEIEVDASCNYVKTMVDGLPKRFSLKDLAQPYLQNPVHKAAAQLMPNCTPCVLPSIIVQLLWAEAGMSVLKPVTIEFKE